VGLSPGRTRDIGGELGSRRVGGRSIERRVSERRTSRSDFLPTIYEETDSRILAEERPKKKKKRARASTGSAANSKTGGKPSTNHAPPTRAALMIRRAPARASKGRRKKSGEGLRQNRISPTGSIPAQQRESPRLKDLNKIFRTAKKVLHDGDLLFLTSSRFRPVAILGIEVRDKEEVSKKNRVCDLFREEKGAPSIRRDKNAFQKKQRRSPQKVLPGGENHSSSKGEFIRHVLYLSSTCDPAREGLTGGGGGGNPRKPGERV